MNTQTQAHTSTHPHTYEKQMLKNTISPLLPLSTEEIPPLFMSCLNTSDALFSAFRNVWSVWYSSAACSDQTEFVITSSLVGCCLTNAFALAQAIRV